LELNSKSRKIQTNKLHSLKRCIISKCVCNRLDNRMQLIRFNPVAVSLATVLALTCALSAQCEPENTTDSKGEKPAASTEKTAEAPASEAATVVAKAKLRDFSKPYGWHLQPILKKINANETQKTKITGIVQSYRTKLEPMRQEYRKVREDFLTCITSNTAAESIMEKQVRLGHLSSDISSTYTLMRLEIRRQLSPNQIVEYEAYCRKQGWMR
jgi:Spy/CpxP family protein refolding chaperone